MCVGWWHSDSEFPRVRRGRAIPGVSIALVVFAALLLAIDVLSRM